jgi:protein-S-isoprenylcysteine O-methyltransferase Ste14
MAEYVILMIIWGAWCCLHSFMITDAVIRFVEKRFEKAGRYYRLFYNVTAFVTLIPVLAYTLSVKGETLFRWEGPIRIVQVLLACSAIVLFISGARRYDLPSFMGIRQIRENETCRVLKEDCSLDRSGILGVVRHPWYAGGILIIWARNLDMPGILMNMVLTGYFLVGAILEEKKLLAEFGEEYRGYQRDVSMLFPFKWLSRALKMKR